MNTTKIKYVIDIGMLVSFISVFCTGLIKYPAFSAAFWSRLGMTFSHGDYSKIEAIKDKDKIAERLFKKSLSYYPNHRAYLGLGLIEQNRKEFEEAVKILSKGVELFPESEQLNLCLGINHMNLGDYNKALSYLLKVQHSREANYYIEQCHKELGD